MTEIKLSIFGRDGSKIRKVSRCRPAVSNETILATRQEILFTKAIPVKSITDIVLLVFLINTALRNFYFIIHYYLLFRKEIYFFDCLYFSEYNIRMSLCVLWLRKGPSIKYVRNCWVDEGHPKCVQLCTGRGGVRPYV